MVYINFCGPINLKTTQILMQLFAEKMEKGSQEFCLLISSGGGQVREGITLYNFLKSLPIQLVTHNIGFVDSIANVVFLAGNKRYANPRSSFLFHGVGFDITQPTRFEEKELRERLTSLLREQALIASIIAERTNLKIEEIQRMFLEAATKTPEEAKKLGIIDEIKEAHVPSGAEMISLVIH